LTLKKNHKLKPFFFFFCLKSLKKDATLTIPMNALFPYLATSSDIFQLQVKQSTITTRIRNYLNADNEISIKTSDDTQCFEYLGTRSDFGPTYINISHGDVFIFGDEKRLHGCEPWSRKDARLFKGRVLLLSRGKCAFFDKVIYAQEAGAKAVIFLNNQKEENMFRILAPTTTANKQALIPSLIINQKDSLSLIHLKRPLTTFSVKDLPSINNDLNAIITLLYRGQRINNIVMINV
jgi:mannosidase alpha-like ER degradation enhancer 1